MANIEYTFIEASWLPAVFTKRRFFGVWQIYGSEVQWNSRVELWKSRDQFQ